MYTFSSKGDHLITKKVESVVIQVPSWGRDKRLVWFIGLGVLGVVGLMGGHHNSKGFWVFLRG